MRWRKRGLIFHRDQLPDWAASSALQPTPLARSREGTARVYCGFRDADGRSRVGTVDIAWAGDGLTVTGVGDKPALDVGAPGAFDQDGVVPSAVCERDGEIWLYYAGYRRGDAHTRFTVFGGTAVSRDGGLRFMRLDTSPTLGPSREARLFRVVHSILPHPEGWQAWYGAGSQFVSGETKTLPVYDIRHCVSRDGRTFPDSGVVCIAPGPGEHRVGRPNVLPAADGYRMFYGAGTESIPYVLRLAASADGIQWRDRSDELGLTRGPDAWDSEMMAYPAFVELAGHGCLLYNGNGYGRDGFGWAELIDG
jgi:hypothetical protein